MSTAGIYYQNVNSSITIVPLSNPSIAPVFTDPSAVPPAPTIKTVTANNNIVTLSGTSSSGYYITLNAVEIFDNGTLIGVASASSTGAWTFTTGPLASGTHTFTAKTANFFGYPSADTAAFTKTI